VHQQLRQGQFADLTDGLQVRDYLDVRDAAAGIVDAAYGSQTGAVNICSGTGITIRQLALRIATGYGRPDLLRFGARSNNIHDPATVVGIRDLTPTGG
jgi:dTDP-6-deoxy-L-talose 4-dehydrogenase (NAD+)